MHHTNEMEKAALVGSNFFDCFRGVNLRRTEIACIVWLLQTLSGSPLMGQATYFFVSAGMTPSTASTLNLIMYSVGFVGTASSWLLMKPFGRRDIYFWGQVALVTIMLITGILGTVDRQSEGALWGIGGLLIVFSLIYQFTIGPVCYALVAEIGSTRLRAKTVVLARNLCMLYSGRRLLSFCPVSLLTSYRQRWWYRRRFPQPIHAQQYRMGSWTQGSLRLVRYRILWCDLDILPTTRAKGTILW